jgi:predicted DCC family thiol-disulfide oxidoreductase YuxK
MHCLAHLVQENRLYAVFLDGRQHSALLGEGVPLATSIATSPDGTLVALGCGSSVLIYRIQNGELQKVYQVGTQIDSSSGSIRLQKLNFSTDSKKLVCATQVASHSTDRHTVHVKVWELYGEEWRNGVSVEPVPLTMVRIIYREVQLLRLTLYRVTGATSA